MSGGVQSRKMSQGEKRHKETQNKGVFTTIHAARNRIPLSKARLAESQEGKKNQESDRRRKRHRVVRVRPKVTELSTMETQRMVARKLCGQSKENVVQPIREGEGAHVREKMERAGETISPPKRVCQMKPAVSRTRWKRNYASG